MVETKTTADTRRTEETRGTLRLWEVLFGDQTGYLKTFTGEQARFSNPNARENELTRVSNRTWRYPEQASAAAAYRP